MFKIQLLVIKSFVRIKKI